MKPFHGILPAVVTPFGARDEFLPTSMELLLERLYGAGVHGIYVCGQTGEGLLQTVAQRKLVAETAVRCSPAGKTVMIHVGAHRTDDAVELARHASSIGAHAISSLPPAGRYSFGEVKAYYEALAAASSVPVLVYYFPAVSTAVETLGHILELCSIPGVVGLKFTDFDLHRLSQVHETGAVIFSGRDEVISAGLLMGADGGIGSFYNLVPELFVKIYDLARTGNFAGTRCVQRAINRLIEVVLRYSGISGIKTVLGWAGIECGGCVGPMRELTDAEKASLRRDLDELLKDEIYAGCCGLPK